MIRFIFCPLLTLLVHPISHASADRLEQLLESAHSSPTLSQWHQHREKLETEGHQIWVKHRNTAEFCERLEGLSDDKVFDVSAWAQSDPGLCSEHILARAKQILIARKASLDDQSVFATIAGLEMCNPALASKNKLGPTREVILDTTGGPRLVTGGLKKCEINFSFDDGPHPSLTRQLVKSLEKENIRANFFTVGRNVDRYGETVNRIADSESVVGNHSFSHQNLTKLSFSAAKKEIVGGFNSLLKLWDFTTPFFRFPYGAFTKRTRLFNQNNDVAEFFWNMDSLDWKIKKSHKLLKRVFAQINREKRGIILFHDIHPQTIDVIPKVLVGLRQAGYSTAVFVPEDLIEGRF